MDDLTKLFNRQELWQKERRLLSWPEKIHMIEAARESLLKLRQSADTQATAPRRSLGMNDAGAKSPE